MRIYVYGKRVSCDYNHNKDGHEVSSLAFLQACVYVASAVLFQEFGLRGPATDATMAVDNQSICIFWC